MKPFGVRLAAGAITILLGALAAAQAQKDRGDRHESDWNLAAAAAPGQLPAPIVGVNADATANSEASDPAASPNSLLARMPAGPLGDVAPISNPASSEANASYGGVAQVQYTEPANGPANSMPLPDSLGAGPVEAPSFNGAALQTPQPSAAADTPNFDVPSFNPPATDSAAAEPMPTAESSGWGLPAALLGINESAAPATQNEAVMVMDVPTQEPEAGGYEAATMGLPAVASMGLPTASTMAAAEGPQTFTNPSDASEQPSNMLRGDNSLRGDTPEMPYGTSDQFSAQPSVANNQAASVDAAPQGNAAPQGDYGQPNFAAQAMSPDAAPSLQTPPSFESAADAAGGYGGYPAANGPAANYGPAETMPGSNAYPAESPTYNAGGNVANERIASRTLQPGMMNQAAPSAAPQQFDAPIAAQPVRVNPAETLASPGDRRLEGIQSPSIVIQKRAPSEVKVGKPASFVIHVQNVGSVEALDVQVHDRVPQGMRMIDASPTPQQQGEILVWELGSMPAGDERTVTMQLVPEQEGELGSVARVTFEAAASVRTMSTRPELKVVQRAPEQVLIGQQLEIEVEVSNPGSGAATGVVVQEDVPEGLEHPKGKQLDNLLGDLAPGETRHQVLRMRAVAPGMIQNTIRLVADDGLTTEHTVNVEVIAPEIQVALAGPARRFLERPATYQLEIVNNGTADATHVEIKAQLDRGFTFVSTDFEGQYDPAQHVVSWYLESLPKGGRGQVPLTLLPVEEGNRKIILDARADLGVIAKSESSVTVESLAEMTFQITDSADPIEVGSESIYEIRVKNSGSRDDSNVRVQLQLPPGIERIASDGDAQEDGRGGMFFAPKPLLAANSELVYQIRVRGVAEGTHIVKAIVTSDQSAVPVTKEESTMVYSDR